MKRTIITLLVVLATAAVVTVFTRNGQHNISDNSGTGHSPGDTASISFNEYEHNFGTVKAGEKVGCVFTFRNNGTAPLVISSATTSCGCTVSKYDTKPVGPGQTGTVEVVFDSEGHNGRQSKSITIRSNATRPVVLLRITGEVKMDNNN